MSGFQRRIIHVDMDAFYASVEQRDRPEIRGKPVAVGGNKAHRGVVCSASYEARKFGVRSAMSAAQALKLCPQVIFISPKFEKYVEASREIRAIFKAVTPFVEPLSLDEAYLDVTENTCSITEAGEIASQIQKNIFSRVKLTASAGVGPNKFIAKLASDLKKPNGLVIVSENQAFQFVEKLPVQKFWGVGPATAKKLNTLGIHTAEDIRKQPMSALETKIGSYAHFLFQLAHGEDDREVDTSWDPKSRGSETTFRQDTNDIAFLLNCLQDQASEISKDLAKINRLGKSVTVKIKFSNFSTITRSKVLFHPTSKADDIFSASSELIFRETQIGERSVRLIGTSVGNLLAHESPLQLWFDFTRT